MSSWKSDNFFNSFFRWSNIVIVLLVVSWGTQSCSHTKPYVNSGQENEQKINEAGKVLATRVILIGDAGKAKENDSVMIALNNWSLKAPQRTTVFFLGDNIYPSGLPTEDDPSRSKAEKYLLAQINAVKGTGARAVFLAGNHDWKSGGTAAIQRQQEFLNSHLLGESNLLPRDGCPGPVKIDLKKVRIIIMNSEWWLREDKSDKSECTFHKKSEVVKGLKTLMETSGDREIVILGHHPISTHGPHGGFYSWKDHLFPLTNKVNWMWIPLPVVGSIYPLGRWHFVRHNQDLNGKLNKIYRDSLTAAAKYYQPLFYASGHEHSLQVLHDKTDTFDYLLVSGSGSKTSELSHGDDTLFAHSHLGFMVVDFFEDNSIYLQVVESQGIIFYKWLKI
jgi:hypothetical protein